ncbi:MAG: hypothetical protein BGP04_10840 [Rhizobiales bacterium 62-17]|nr:DUF3592 domain-containing protein [Hyphomicrobiales bacterium]OJY05821.1 MAG: hypothetical protein BGP04_10840 [Rhizobiales bacterium 62-17]
MPSPARSLFWPIAIPMAIGVLLLLAAAANLAPTLAFLARAKATEGIFIGAISRPGGNHAGVFLYPQFSFLTDPNAPARVVTSSSGSTSPPYADGDTARIWYDPAHPEHAVISSFWTLWAGPTFLAIPGLLFTLIPLIVLVFMRRPKSGRETIQS